MVLVQNPKQPNKNPQLLNTYLMTYTKFSSKWITVINIKCKTIKLLEDNRGENIENFGHGIDFLIYTKGMLYERNNCETSQLKLKINHLYFKRECEENNKSSHRLEEYIFRRHMG
jgi:hypothetical protein